MENACENPAQSIIDWIKSPEGEKRFKEAMAEVKKVSTELNEARMLTPELLNAPMGPPGGSWSNYWAVRRTA